MKIFENWELKIVAIIFSISIWFYVQGKGLVETALRYSVYFTGMPETLYLDEVNTPEIVVWVKGPKHLLNNFMNNSNRIEISLRGQRAGRLVFDISQEKLNLPSNFQILKIQPEKIIVRLAPIIERRLKVVPRYSGNRKIKVTPESVIVKGPKYIMENVKYVETEDFTNNEGNKKIGVKLISPSEKITLKPDSVNILFLD
ncbi:MAG: hypothetical protein N2202_05750 [Proteobacteria bacterium]|nr:hypothetical protein [Pseudomonadota bacterium]